MVQLRASALCFRGVSRQAAATASSFVVLLALLLSIAGCAAQLSPAFDQTTYTNLTALNVKAETLFASLSGGGTARNFPRYKDTYDELIGGFSAALITTRVREVPPASRRLLSASALQSVCGDDPTDCVNPTPRHLQKVIELLTVMRDRHQAGKLVAELVSGFDGQGGFKGQYEIEMSSVLVFEGALQR